MSERTPSGAALIEWFASKPPTGHWIGPSRARALKVHLLVRGPFVAAFLAIQIVVVARWLGWQRLEAMAPIYRSTRAAHLPRQDRQPAHSGVSVTVTDSPDEGVVISSLPVDFVDAQSPHATA